MELKTYFAQDLQGNVIPSPTVYIYQPGTTTLSTGLQTASGAALTNPFTGSSTGQIQLRAPNGAYDMRIAGAGRDYTVRVQFIDLDQQVAEAQSLLNDFKGRWYGALASDPAADPLGAPVGAGDAYFNTTLNQTRVYSGTAWQAPFNPTDSSAVAFQQAGTGAVATTVQDKLRPLSLLENKAALRDFFKGLYTYQQTPASTRIGIACYGDSVASHTWSPLCRFLFQSYQNAAYVSPPSGNLLPGASTPTTTGTVSYTGAEPVNQSVYDGTGGFRDFTYLPNGAHVTLQNGATATANLGQNTGVNEVRCYLATGPGMGSALVELLSEAGATLQSTIINLSGTQLGATKAAFTGISKTVKYKLRVTATGKVVYLLTIFLRPNGIVPINFQCGGSTLAQNNYANPEIFKYLINDLNIKLLVTQCKEENAAVNVPATIAIFNTLTACSKLVVGSLPDNGDAAALRAVNAIFRTNALANNCAYFDGYEAFGSYEELTRLGWNGDGVHPTDGANQFVAALILGELGANFFLGGKETRTISNANSGAVIGGAAVVQTNALQIIKGDGSEDFLEVISSYGGMNPNSVSYKCAHSYSFDGGISIMPYGTYGISFLQSDGSSPALIRPGWIETLNTTYASTFSGPVRVKSLEITSQTLTSGANAGTNGAPPAQVANYLQLPINGTVYKIPLYAN